MMTRNQNGNAVIFVLLGIVLFGLLSYTLINSAKMGQGNLTKHQAGLKAQELLNFLSNVEKGISKLRSRGCAENQISAWTSNHGGYYNSQAPTDRSCHLFDSKGAGLTLLETADFQIPLSSIPVGYTTQYNNMYYFVTNEKVQNLETTSNELLAQINFVDPDICSSYNEILKNNVTFTVTENNNLIAGDQNTTLAGLNTFCFYKTYVGITHTQIIYVWIPK